MPAPAAPSTIKSPDLPVIAARTAFCASSNAGDWVEYPLPTRCEQGSEVVERGRVVGVELQRLAQSNHRFVHAPRGDERRAQIEVRSGFAGNEASRLGELRNRVINAANLQIEQRQVVDPGTRPARVHTRIPDLSLRIAQYSV